VVKLRDYQEYAVEELFSYLKKTKNGNPVIAMPTGTGKSVVIAAIVKRLMTEKMSKKILVLTHVKELIKQNATKMAQLLPAAPLGIYSAGLKEKETTYPITFAGIASVARNLESFSSVDTIIIDECHLVSPKQATMYQRTIKHFLEKTNGTRVIGLTATPYRTKSGKLTEGDGAIFTDIVVDMIKPEVFAWFFKQGYLSLPVPLQPTFEFDLSGVHSSMGDYVKKELAEVVDKEERTNQVVEEAIACAGERKHWLVFASGIEHALHVCERLNTCGVKAVAIHSKMPAAERDKNIEDYTTGRVKALVNNGILTTGFDHPQTDLILMLRPTRSPGLWVQMLGRGIRPVYAEGHPVVDAAGRLAAIAAGPKPNCLVLDFAGNAKRLGPINQPAVPAGRTGKGAGGGPPPYKVCPTCCMINSAAARTCPNCGYAFPQQLKLSTVAATEQLVRGVEKNRVEVEVDKVGYKVHRKKGAPDSFRVSYYAGLRHYDEWLCFEHAHVPVAQRIAKRWWKRFAKEPYPASVEEALLRTKEITPPKKILVDFSAKYPEVVNYVDE
jgi:DNA repair protein RadD